MKGNQSSFQEKKNNSSQEELKVNLQAIDDYGGTTSAAVAEGNKDYDKTKTGAHQVSSAARATRKVPESIKGHSASQRTSSVNQVSRNSVVPSTDALRKPQHVLPQASQTGRAAQNLRAQAPGSTQSTRGQSIPIMTSKRRSQKKSAQASQHSMESHSVQSRHNKSATASVISKKTNKKIRIHSNDQSEFRKGTTASQASVSNKNEPQTKPAKNSTKLLQAKRQSRTIDNNDSERQKNKNDRGPKIDLEGQSQKDGTSDLKKQITVHRLEEDDEDSQEVQQDAINLQDSQQIDLQSSQDCDDVIDDDQSPKSRSKKTVNRQMINNVRASHQEAQLKDNLDQYDQTFGLQRARTTQFKGDESEQDFEKPHIIQRQNDDHIQEKSQIDQQQPQSPFILNNDANVTTANQNEESDANIQSVQQEQLSTSVAAVEDDKRRKILPPPNPLLPKTLKVQDKPPESSIKGIVFKKLKEFKQFPEQPADQLAEQVKTIKRVKNESLSPTRGREGVASMGSVQISIEQSRLIRNIVYLRDVTILDNLGKSISELTQKDVFQHENFIDVKNLIRERDISERMLDQLENAISRAKRQQQKQLSSMINAKQAPIGALDVRNGSYKLDGIEDKTLLFESRFESGNLYLATKVSEQEYDLLMQNDTNTLGHTQWFYFSVKNTRAQTPVKFNILNYNKPDSMFNYGMKVSVYSDRKAELGQMGWHRACTDISYFKNQVRKDFNNSRFYNTLTFTYEFEHDNDTVFFAYCFPYTYSDLQNDVMKIERDKRRACLLQRSTLCKTLGGVNCEVFTITEPQSQSAVTAQKGLSSSAQQARNNNTEAEGSLQKPAVVISARVHPGETVGSWMMRGVINFLTDADNKEAKILRKNFIFKIVPMLNPDGVINGNYRCSLAGCDLNRRWKFPSKQIQPTVYHTKRLIKKVHNERTCLLYCDLHGHSRKPNIFMYGCDVKGAPEETRIFPLLLSKISPLFDFGSSRFGVQKSKESTARVAVFKELKNCPLIYTMESTFSGMDLGPHAGSHITTDMLESMGRDLCRALLIQNNLEVPQELKSMPTVKTMKTRGKTSKKFSNDPGSDDGEMKVQSQHAFNIKQTLIAELQNNKELMRAGAGDSSSGSDSEPSEDNLEATELVKNLPGVDKPLSMALKQEQQARKEQAKIKRQERTSSPMKGDQQQQRWRFTTTANLKDQDADSPTKLKKGRSTAIKLSEIKEVGGDDQSNASPLKVVRDVINRQPVKNAKAKMVDAVTQTEKSDYFLLKQRQNNKQLKLTNFQQSLGSHQNSIQLRIANIELHKTTSLGGGPQQHHSALPSGRPTQSQSHQKEQTNNNPLLVQQPIMGLTATTVNMNFMQQGPTVSDFNAIFQQNQQQPSSASATNHNRQIFGKTNNAQQPQHNHNSDLANALNYEQQKLPMKQRQAISKPQSVPIAAVSQHFSNYMTKNKQKANNQQLVGKTTVTQAAEYQTNPSAVNIQAVSEETRNNQSHARYGSVQQPRLKQLQDFQAQSRAVQQEHKTTQQIQPQVNIYQGATNQVDLTNSPYVSIPQSSEQFAAKETDLAIIQRMNHTGASKKRVIVDASDYSANNFKKTKRFQIGNNSVGNHQVMQNQQRSAMKNRETIENDDSLIQVIGPGHLTASMLVEEAQLQNKPQNASGLQESNSKLQQRMVMAHHALTAPQTHGAPSLRQSSDQRHTSNNLMIVPQQTTSVTGLNNQNGGQQQQQSTNSPLIAFLESQINFEKHHLQATGTNFLKSQQTDNNFIASNLSRTNGFLQPQQIISDEQKTAGTTVSNLIQLKPINSSVNNSSILQQRSRIYSHSTNQNHQKQSALIQMDQPADTYQDPIQSQYQQQLFSHKSEVSPTQKMQQMLSGGTTTTNTVIKPIPAGVRNQVQNQSKSNVYSQVYQQSKTETQQSLTQPMNLNDQTNQTQQRQSSNIGQILPNASVKYHLGTTQQSQLQNFTLTKQQTKPAKLKLSKQRGSQFIDREKRTISEMQVYNNRSPGLPQSDHSLLPNLQKFGSQNEILSATMTHGSMEQLNNSSLVGIEKYQSMNKTPQQLGKRFGLSTIGNTQVNQWPRNPQSQIMTSSESKQKNTMYQTSVGYTAFETQQPNNQASNRLNNNHIATNQAFRKNNATTDLSRAHAEGRPSNEMRHRSQVNILHNNQEQPQSPQTLAIEATNHTTNNVRTTKLQPQRVNSLQSTQGQAQKIQNVLGSRTTVLQQNSQNPQNQDSDYLQLMKQYHQAFKPTPAKLNQSSVLTTNSKKNSVSLSSQGGNRTIAVPQTQKKYATTTSAAIQKQVIQGGVSNGIGDRGQAGLQTKSVMNNASLVSSPFKKNPIVTNQHEVFSKRKLSQQRQYHQ